MQEYVYHKLLEFDNLKSVKFDFIRLNRNDEDMGIYSMEGIPVEKFILRNGYSEGIVLALKSRLLVLLKYITPPNRLIYPIK